MKCHVLILQLIVFVGKMTADELLSICICMNYYGQWFYYFYITVIKFFRGEGPSRTHKCK